VGTTERIWNVAGIIVGDDSLRKAVVVSAMSKVTDMMYGLLQKAESRDDAYEDALEAIRVKHVTTATELLGNGKELDNILRIIEEDVVNLSAMLRAIYIGENQSEFEALII
jgi:aspartokinase/homoserine dehydrogenase 1